MVIPTDIKPTENKRVYDTLPKLMSHNFDRWADETALCQKKLGIWKKYTWRRYYEIAGQFSLGIISLGLERRDTVCICGENAPEWLWSELAVQSAGGIAAAIPVDVTTAALKQIITNTRAKFAVVSGRKQAAKILENKAYLPSLKKIIYWDAKGLKNDDNPLLLSFNDVLKLGEEYEKTNSALFQQNIDRGTSDDITVTFYTSGMKEPPMGSRMSHKALMTNGQAFLKRFPLLPEDKLIFNIPAADVISSYFSAVPHLLTGAALNFPEKPETAAIDTHETAPDFVFYPHQLWASLAAEIRTKVKESHGLKRFFYDSWLQTSYKIADDRLQNKKPSLISRLNNIPGNCLFFGPIKSKLGLNKVRLTATDGPGLSRDDFRLIYALGISVRQIYANAEAGFISSHTEGEFDAETVGRPAVNTEIRIANNGELLVRSNGLFDGYNNNPEKTAGVLIDGWYRTGDTARITEKGHIVILTHNEADKAKRT